VGDLEISTVQIKKMLRKTSLRYVAAHGFSSLRIAEDGCSAASDEHSKRLERNARGKFRTEALCIAHG
jgi:hypothetical protein